MKRLLGYVGLSVAVGCMTAPSGQSAAYVRCERDTDCSGLERCVFLPGVAGTSDPAQRGQCHVTDGAGMRGFSNDLLRVARPATGNFAVSPFSAATALGMTAEGARRQTQSEMLEVLHFSNTDDGVRLARLAQIYAEQQGITFASANRIFGDQGYPFDTSFVARLQNDYQSPLESVDFQHAFEPARMRINAWVAESTRDRIQDLLRPGIVDATTRLVLVNALYFRGTWASQFQASQTRPLPFNDGANVRNVDTMTRSGRARVSLDANVQVLDLPYSNPRFSMTFVVPSDLASFENDPNAIQNALAGLHDEPQVEIYLPKFRVEGSSVSLKPALMELGMPTAFSDAADLSGMIGPGGQPLYVADVVQKVFVEVNEEGAEAAAATAVIVDTRSAALPAVFRADRPFYFVLRDATLDVPLFVGRVVSP